MRMKAALLMIPLAGLALTAQQQHLLLAADVRVATGSELSGAGDGSRQPWQE